MVWIYKAHVWKIWFLVHNLNLESSRNFRGWDVSGGIDHIRQKAPSPISLLSVSWLQPDRR